MRKLIEHTQEHSIVCDNIACNYKVLKSEDDRTQIGYYLNRPCPDCGENLLTEKDLRDYINLMKYVSWMNKWFSWITIFAPKRKNPKITTIHVHNGINVEEKKK